MGVDHGYTAVAGVLAPSMLRATYTQFSSVYVAHVHMFSVLDVGLTM